MNKIRIIFIGIVGGMIIAGVLSMMVPYKITTVLSNSMEPSLRVGDKILIHITSEFSRGSIITFYKTFEDDDESIRLFVVKRVVGVEGDHIVSDGEFLSRNGEVICECDVELNFIVPAECLFVLGDNRESSFDSRFWEEPFVRVGDVIGVVERKLLW